MPYYGVITVFAFLTLALETLGLGRALNLEAPVGSGTRGVLSLEWYFHDIGCEWPTQLLAGINADLIAGSFPS